MNINYNELTIEELRACYINAYNYHQIFNTELSKETLDAISAAMGAKVSA
jgi:hypothetical protein